jgi:uncharacterized MAPEG superfamily protein
MYGDLVNIKFDYHLLHHCHHPDHYLKNHQVVRRMQQNNFISFPPFWAAVLNLYLLSSVITTVQGTLFLLVFMFLYKLNAVDMFVEFYC